MKSLINNNVEARKGIFAILNNNDELALSDSQNLKGYTFLMNEWKTPRGIERKNNPFGYREQEILDNFSHFTVRGFYDAGNFNHSYYLPLYMCYDKNGDSFKYYYNGKVNIVG